MIVYYAQFAMPQAALDDHPGADTKRHRLGLPIEPRSTVCLATGEGLICTRRVGHRR